MCVTLHTAYVSRYLPLTRCCHPPPPPARAIIMGFLVGGTIGFEPIEIEKIENAIIYSFAEL